MLEQLALHALLSAATMLGWGLVRRRWARRAAAGTWVGRDGA